MSSKIKKKKAVFNSSLYENVIDTKKCSIGDDKIESWILSLCAAEKKRLNRKQFVLLIAAICPVVTRRLYQIVLSYPVSNNSYISTILRELAAEGMLLETVLDKQKYYKITKKGFDCINEVVSKVDEAGELETGLNLSLDIQTPYEHYTNTIENRKEGILAESRKKRVRKKFAAPFHSNGVSQVLCQMLRSGLKFDYALEAEMKEGPLIHLLESVKTDMVVKVDSNYLYVEQDTGTETIGLLADKIFRYCNASYSFDSNAVYSKQLLFSFEKKYENRGSKSASHNSILQSKVKLMAAGYGMDMMLEDVLRGLGGELRDLRNVIEEFIEKSNQVAVYDKIEAKKYTVADYCTYVEEVRNGTSRIEKIYKNCSEYNFARNRFLHLSHSYCEATDDIDKVDGDGCYRGVDVLHILRGLNVYGIPTYRVIDTLPLLFPYQYNTFSLLRKSLVSLSTFIEGEPHEEEFENMRFNNSFKLPEHFFGKKRHLPVSFNNVLYYEYDPEEELYNVHTIVEYISGNIAGYVRMYYLLKKVEYRDLNIRCVGIVENENDAKEFLDYVNLDEKIERDISFSQNSIKVYFIKTCDLGTEKFFSVTRDGKVVDIAITLEF